MKNIRKKLQKIAYAFALLASIETIQAMGDNEEVRIDTEKLKEEKVYYFEQLCVFNLSCTDKKNFFPEQESDKFPTMKSLYEQLEREQSQIEAYKEKYAFLNFDPYNTRSRELSYIGVSLTQLKPLFDLISNKIVENFDQSRNTLNAHFKNINSEFKRCEDKHSGCLQLDYFLFVYRYFADNLFHEYLSKHKSIRFELILGDIEEESKKIHKTCIVCKLDNLNGILKK